MRLIGTVIPFIGFREIEVDADLRQFLHVPSHIKKLNSFQLEWLGCAVIYPLMPKDVS